MGTCEGVRGGPSSWERLARRRVWKSTGEGAQVMTATMTQTLVPDGSLVYAERIQCSHGLSAVETGRAGHVLGAEVVASMQPRPLGRVKL